MDYFTRSPGLVPLPRQTASDASQQKTLLPPQSRLDQKTNPCLDDSNRIFTSLEAAKCGDDRVFHTLLSPQAFPRIYTKNPACGKSFCETRLSRLRGTALRCEMGSGRGESRALSTRVIGPTLDVQKYGGLQNLLRRTCRFPSNGVCCGRARYVHPHLSQSATS
jgi:hypothetical protein